MANEIFVINNYKIQKKQKTLGFKTIFCLNKNGLAIDSFDMNEFV